MDDRTFSELVRQGKEFFQENHYGCPYCECKEADFYESEQVADERHEINFCPECGRRWRVVYKEEGIILEPKEHHLTTVYVRRDDL